VSGTAPRVVALTGGVGGAKLGLGLARRLAAEDLAFVVNTGDDFEHLGLTICPDLDTLLYTLAGEADPERGWGRRDESWRFLETLAALGGERWFALGDRDLALHVVRTRALAEGRTLSEVTAALAARLGVGPALLPMSDDPVRTKVATADGELSFQHYFVRERCAPAVTGFRFDGAHRARANPAVLEALASPRLEAIVLCPSNPFVSLDPILAVPGLHGALEAAAAPVVAVSPLVGGLAVKGPTAKMMEELAVPRTAPAVASHYGALLDGLVLDAQDADEADAVRAVGPAVTVTRTLMESLEDRLALADAVLAFAGTLRE
jgi:LPPG:FO 2-phospho-L-lactate transferase